jgi:hypothetical protein
MTLGLGPEPQTTLSIFKYAKIEAQGDKTWQGSLRLSRSFSTQPLFGLLGAHSSTFLFEWKEGTGHWRGQV